MSQPDSILAGGVPASPGQERLWLVANTDPLSTAYAIPVGYHLRARVTLDSFATAVAALVSRHDALRTGIVWTEDGLAQQIYPSVSVNVKSIASADINEFISELQQAATLPFDLSTPPLVRCLHAALAATGTAFGFVFHHAVCDSWSLDLFMHDLSTLLAGSPPTGAAGQHARWSVAERAWLRTSDADRDRDYWRRRVDGGVPPLDLGHGTRRRDRRQGNVRRFDLPVALVDGLSAQLSVTRFSVMLAAFGALLHRYSTHDRVAIGLPVAGRHSPEAERTLGYLSNTVVTIEEITSQTTFRQLAADVLRHVADALEHGRLPFQEIVHAAQVPRDQNPPLYQAMFGPQNTTVGTIREINGHPLERIQVHNGTAKCDLTLSVETVGNRVECELEYDCDLFDAPWAQRFCNAYLQLIVAAAQAPETYVDELPLVPDDLVIAAFAERPDANRYEGEPPAHAVVTQQALANPDAIAVRQGLTALTYRQLDARANALAARLLESGAGEPVRVGLLLDRGADLIVAILGSMKAGAAFVPLDRRFPTARIAAICADARVTTLITERVDPALAGLARVIVPNDAARQAQPPTGVCPDDLAFIYYTSGSTGSPKGVPTDHRSLMTRLAYLRDAYPLSAGEAVLHKTPIIFDIAVWEIFLPLFVGGTVVVMEAGQEADSGQIVNLLRREPVVLVHFVASALNTFLDTTDPVDYPKLRCVIVSGEAASADLIRQARKHFGVPVHSQYGQTESAEVAVWDGEGDGTGKPGASMLGRPVGAYSLYVVDPALHPVPRDVPGELCVSGSGGLVWGYLHQPVRTAERFVPHPNPSQPGQRLYRTGDLARVLGSGLIEYLGRVDQQLKIRGCRVEPGEIENIIRAHQDVSACAVVGRASVDSAEMVAYVTATAGVAPSPVSLAKHVQDRLPWFMVPSAFVVLADLPKTMSGKVDRTCLPPPDDGAFPARHEDVTAPIGPLEAAIADEWARVLGVSQVSRHDDFFLIGGSSLSAVRILTAMGKRFGIPLRVKDFDCQPTVAALAETIERGVANLVEGMPEHDVVAMLETLRSDETSP